EVVSYGKSGETDYVVERAPGANASAQVVFHRQIGSKRRKELSQFAAPERRSALDVATPPGCYLVHLGCFEVPAAKVSRFLPNLAPELMSSVQSGKTRVYAARWTKSCGNDRQKRPLIGYVQLGPESEQPFTYATLSGEKTTIRVRFIRQEPQIVRTSGELERSLRLLLGKEYARVMLFGLAMGDNGRAEDFHMEIARRRDDSVDDVMRAAAYGERLRRIEAMLDDPRVVFAVAPMEIVPLSNLLYEDIKSGNRTLPSTKTENNSNGWLRSVLLFDHKDGRLMPFALRMFFDGFAQPTAVPGQSILLRTLGRQVAEKGAEYSSSVQASDDMLASEVNDSADLEEAAAVLGERVEQSKSGGASYRPRPEKDSSPPSSADNRKVEGDRRAGNAKQKHSQQQKNSDSGPLVF